MNTMLVTSIPPGTFEEVSIEQPHWQERFMTLIRHGRLITYDVNTMPQIPAEIDGELSRRGYCKLVLSDNDWQRWLIPGKSLDHLKAR